jgi:hypothetical protein
VRRTPIGHLELHGRGGRKYLTTAERQRFIAAARRAPYRVRLFCFTLAWGGGRLSETLALTAAAIDLQEGVANFETLKRRKPGVVRQVPLPGWLLRDLDREFDLRSMQCDPDRATRRLWSWSRTTAWRYVKRVMAAAGIWGKAACPKGLRHTFGVASFQAAVPPHLVQRWLGHASPRTTAIYGDVAGSDERAFAARMWRGWPRRRHWQKWSASVAFFLATLLIAIVTSRLAWAQEKNDPPQSVAPAGWEVAFGSAMMTDNNIRGITISAHQPSVGIYVEPTYKLPSGSDVYVGISGESIDIPNRSPTQLVYYGGFRPKLGGATFDLGGSYLAYPGGITFNGLGAAASCTNGAFFFGQCNTAKGNENFFEAYGKLIVSPSDAVSLGANLFFSPSWVNSGAPGTYASATTKLTLPQAALPKAFGTFISGEIGYYWYGTTDAFYGVPAFPSGIKLPDYLTWNLGIGFTYKAVTLDLRYYDTDLSKANCNVLTGDHTATFGGASAASAINPSGLVSDWCGAAFIAKLSFDSSFRIEKK